MKLASRVERALGLVRTVRTNRTLRKSTALGVVGHQDTDQRLKTYGRSEGETNLAGIEPGKW